MTPPPPASPSAAAVAAAAEAASASAGDAAAPASAAPAAAAAVPRGCPPSACLPRQPAGWEEAAGRGDWGAACLHGGAAAARVVAGVVEGVAGADVREAAPLWRQQLLWRSKNTREFIVMT